MEFAEMGYLQEVCLDLPVSLLTVLHIKQLECEKSMDSMASFHHSLLHWSICGSTARFFLVRGIQEGAIKTFTPLIPTQYAVVSATT